MATQILMPALSPTMTEGTLARWLKKEGDTVSSGDLLAEIETDKATMELEAVDDGILGKIIVQEGSEGIAVNTPIAVVLEEGEDPSAADDMSAAPAPAAAAPEPEPAAEPAPQASAPQAAPQAAPQSSGGARTFASPLARRMAADAGIDIAAISGSGPHGRVVKRDVEAAIAGGGAAAAPAAAPAAAQPPAVVDQAKPPAPAPAAVPGQEFDEVPHSNMRKVIAQRLSESKQTVPHFYLTVDCEIDKLLELRKDLNGRSPEGEGAYKISVNDFVVRAVALSMRKVPMVNVSWTDAAMRVYKSIDVSVAVAIDGGLITPIVRNADHKGLAEISVEMKDLATRARDGKLAPEEYQGGGFSISNLGMFGVKDFSAIINPPQSCILAVGAGEQRPMVKDGALSVATVMSCTLSVDHRAVDGALGAQFLQAFKGMIEDPLTMML
jgi:pyruvate dehydrogenase E2 component (dihydrolipoamide acetyltransferase)